MQGKHFLRLLPAIVLRVERVPTELVALGKKYKNRTLIRVYQIQLDASGKMYKERKKLRKELTSRGEGDQEVQKFGALPGWKSQLLLIPNRNGILKRWRSKGPVNPLNWVK